MTLIRVWAPYAHKVEVESGGSKMEMERTRDGWWRGDIEGPDYCFRVDGGDPLPDPRSPWQPHGVHGASRLVDHRAFRWTDESWQAPPLASAIVYELHIGTFTPEGTFDSAIEKLDYLKQLGITHVELMPVQEFSGDWGWGYDGVALFAPHHSYGGPAGLKRLVDACHGRGIAILLDVVYNHLGPVGNYLAKFGPYFTETYETPWGPAINFDGPGSTEVRRFFCDNALMWLRDYHMDGLRLDAIHAIHDSSAIHILEQLSSEVEDLEAGLGRHLVLIAESDLNDTRVVMPREANGYGIKAQWSDDFHHALHAVLTGERSGYYEDFGTMADLAKSLTDIFVYDGRESSFRKRRHGRPTGALSGDRFLGYLQNHDQVGNRAKGERSSALVSEGRLKIGAALVFCAPFVPMIFQGEEFAASTPFLYFSSHRDPEIAKAVSEGRKREFAAFGWDPADVPDPQDPATFLRSKLNWSEASGEMLDWYRSLIALRRSRPELSDGRRDRLRVTLSEAEQWIAIQRGSIHIICNVSTARRCVPMPGSFTTLLASKPPRESFMEPESVTILQEVFP